MLAQAEVPNAPQDAAQRAHDVLDRVSADRLRSTARTRLSRLSGMLADRNGTAANDLTERLRTLPPPTDAHGQVGSV